MIIQKVSIKDRESRKKMGKRKEGQAGAEDTGLITGVLTLYFIYPETQN